MFSELRKKNGLTQQDLANKLSVKQSTVSMWENGGALPRGHTLLKLSNLLNIDAGTILNSLQNSENTNKK